MLIQKLLYLCLQILNTMPKKIYTTLPTRFGVCMHADCPMASMCLRQIAYSQMTEGKDFLHMTNPRHCSKDSTCRFYRDASRARYAQGFTNFQKRMYPEQYREFMSTLIIHFGRSAYFERRNGDTILSPAEQEVVLDALHKAGVKEDFHFDKYLDLYNWFD